VIFNLGGGDMAQKRMVKFKVHLLRNESHPRGGERKVVSVDALNSRSAKNKVKKKYNMKDGWMFTAVVKV